MDSKNKPHSHRGSSSNLPAEVHPAAGALVRRSHYEVNLGPSRELPPSEDQEGSASELLDYWRVLARHKRAIALSALVGLALGFAIGIPMKPKFRALTTLEVLTINGDFMNQKSSNPTTTNDGNYDTSEEQTQAKLLEGSALINRVVAKLAPEAAKSQLPPPLATTGWRSWLHLREPVSRHERDALLLAAAKSLKVRPTSRTRVLEITVDSTDPKLAADFANTLTQEFIAQNIEARWQTTQSTSEWLHRELEDARTKLRASEDALQRYASTSGLIFTDETTKISTEKLQQLQQNLSVATADRITKQSKYELAQSAPPDSLGDVLNDASLRETLIKITETKRQLADANAIYAPESTKVQRLQAELASLQSGFDRQRSDIVASIQNGFTEAERKEKLLAAAYQKQAHEVSGQDEKAIQYNILKRDVDSNRVLYDTMLQQMKQASISSAIHAGNVRVVDPAEIPDLPFSPDFKLNSLLGLVVGVLLSSFVVTIRDRADRTLQQPGEIKQWTDAIELGVIPAASLGGGHYYRPVETASNSRLLGKNTSQAIELITAQKTPTASAEAFRSTLTSMLFVSEEANRARVMAFTSGSPAEGKTTVVSNLGIAAAEIRLRVLLIDADLRRPRLHTIFNVNNDYGLADILTDQTELESASALIKQTKIPNLFLLPAGTPTQAASHLLYSPMWEALLQKLRDEFDMILIDTPPMLQMTDARVAARMVDAVVLVARCNRTTRDAVIAAIERFRGDRIHVLGAILNDWDPKLSRGGYYGYYRQGYYHTKYQEGYASQEN